MQGGRRRGGQLGLAADRDVGIGARELELVEHGPQIQRGAADEHRDDLAARQSEIASRAQPWNSATVAGSPTSSRSSRWCGTPRRSSSASLAVPMSIPAVDLHRVAVDDLATERECELHREVALAGGGRADDGDDWGCGIRPSSRPWTDLSTSRGSGSMSRVRLVDGGQNGWGGLCESSQLSISGVRFDSGLRLIHR